MVKATIRMTIPANFGTPPAPQPHSPITVPMALVHGMLHGARARGLPLAPLLAEVGIPPELLHQPGARVTGEQYAALFLQLIARLDDDVLGLQSRPLRRGSFALIARSAVGAPTLEVAQRRVARTYGLLQDDVQVQLQPEGTLVGFCLHFAERSEPWPEFLHEMLLRVFWRLLAWLGGGKLPVARFDFAFAQPAHADSYARIFPAPLVFEAAHSAFWVEARALRQRVQQDENALFDFLANAQTYVILPPRHLHTTSASVRSLLQQRQPDWPDVAATAEALHLSATTLQRRLASEGTAFQALKDQLRRDLAIARLSSSTVTLPALASELGFADSTAFQRAFKRWTGSPPGAYRRQPGVG